MCGGEPGPSLGESRIEFGRPFERIDRETQAFQAEAVQEAESLQVKLVRPRVPGRGVCGILRTQPQLQRTNDLPGNVALDREDVVERPVIGLGPEV